MHLSISWIIEAMEQTLGIDKTIEVLALAEQLASEHVNKVKEKAL